MKTKKLNGNWKLKSIEIQFKKGYDWENEVRKKSDRYEGVIKFENDDDESFSFKVKPDMAQIHIELIASDIVTAATGLGERLKESLGLS
jgi:hypothetical protein